MKKGDIWPFVSNNLEMVSHAAMSPYFNKSRFDQWLIVIVASVSSSRQVPHDLIDGFRRVFQSLSSGNWHDRGSQHMIVTIIMSLGKDDCGQIKSAIR